MQKESRIFVGPAAFAAIDVEGSHINTIELGRFQQSVRYSRVENR